MELTDNSQIIKELRDKFANSSEVKYRGIRHRIPKEAYLTTEENGIVIVHLFYYQWTQITSVEQLKELKFIPSA